LVHHKNRETALEGLVAVQTDIYGIVFCRTKDQTKEVANTMASHGFTADALHGDLSQVQREYVMNRFRNKVIKVLVATDVAARGIDVENLTHVIHYELPDEKERYIHRSGRTGRAGKKGISIAIVSPRQMGQLHRLEKMIGQSIQKIEVPKANDILKSRLSKFVKEIEEGKGLPSEYEEYAKELVERLSGLPRPTLIQNFLSLYLETLAGGGGIDENINLDPGSIPKDSGHRPGRNGRFNNRRGKPREYNRKYSGKRNKRR
jgi:ATP-dependent RNA helicase DeaD